MEWILQDEDECVTSQHNTVKKHQDLEGHGVHHNCFQEANCFGERPSNVSANVETLDRDAEDDVGPASAWYKVIDHSALQIGAKTFKP